MKTRNKIISGLGALGLIGAFATTGADAAMMNRSIRASGKPPQQYEAVQKALLADDYTAFKTAIASVPKPANAPEITEALFAKMVEAEKLHQSGDIAGAQKIMKELGFKVPGMHRKGSMMKNLTSPQKAALDQAKTLMDAGKPDEAQKILNDAGIKRPNRGVPSNLTDAQKTAFEQARAFFQAGKPEEAKAILDAAGITLPMHLPK